MSPSSYFITCEPYETVNTNYATENYVTCSIPNVCPGDYIIASDCDVYTGDTYFRLFDQSEHYITYADTGCSGDSSATVLAYVEHFFEHPF